VEYTSIIGIALPFVHYDGCHSQRAQRTL
jgi:hypothetical protein